MTDVHRRAVQPQPDRRAGDIEPAVVEGCENDVLHGRPRRRIRDHPAHQEACDGGVAVGKVVNVGLFVVPVRKAGCFVAGQADVVERIDCRHRRDVGAEIGGQRLERGEYPGLADTEVVAEIASITDAAQHFQALRDSAAGKRVVGGGQQGQHLVAGRPWHRHGFHRCLQGAPGPGQGQGVAQAAQVDVHDPVDAPTGLVEEDRATEPVPAKEAPVVGFVETVQIDAEIGEQDLGGIGIGCRRLQGLGAAVADQFVSLGQELVALGVTAKVVVIVQYEQAGIRMLLQVEVRRCQAADAGAHDDQVIVVDVLVFFCGCPGLPRGPSRACLARPVRGRPRRNRHGCRAGR